MLASIAALALLLQVPAPRVQVTSDRARVGVGEVVLVTITAQSSDPRPVTITVNPPDGLSVIERLESSDADLVSPGSVVTATLTLRMRAMEPGRWPVGPVRALVGGTVTDVAGVIVEVGEPPDISVLVSNPRLRTMLERAPPPVRRGDVTLRLLTSSASVRTGAQVDVVAAAWFPRALRLQLRRPPVLQPPVIGGVWSRAQGAGSGLVTSRRINDEWYDLFVAHQIVFPLAAGTVAVPRALLRFGSAASPDEQTELFDGPGTIVARPLPSGAPTGFAGAVGSGLRLTRRVDGVPRAGEGITVEITVAGRGNASLWPSPELTWPAGARAYPDGTDDAVDVIDGQLGGEKTFRFAVVPARPGALTLPSVSYPYFDPGSDSYREARLEAGSIAVRLADPRVAATPRLALLAEPRRAWARVVARGIPVWGWVLLLLAPVALPALRARRRQRPPRDAHAAGEDRLARVLERLIDPRRHEEIGAALRAHGATAVEVVEVLRVRSALAHAAYGPGAVGVPPSLSREAAVLAARLEALATQASSSSAAAKTARTATALVLLIVAAAPIMRTQQQGTAEAAFARGDFGTAAARFLSRTATSPADAAPWYNLGAASLAAGDETAAAAAFVRAARRAPRDPIIRAAAAALPTTDRAARAARSVPPVSADEAALLGLLCWWCGWIVLWARDRRRWRERGARLRAAGAVLLVVACFLLAGSGWLRARESVPLALLREAVPMRRSPHERGESVGELAMGAAVRMARARHGWTLVEAPAGSGWVPSARLVPLGE